MKSYLVILGLLLIYQPSFTQITLEPAHIGRAGDVFYNAVDTSNIDLISPGVPGTAINWDFRQLSTDFVEDIRFLAPQNTPFADDFPEADIAIPNENTFLYFSLNANSLELIGGAGDPTGNGIIISAPVEPSQLVLPFPFTYGDQFTDTSLLEAKVAYAGFPGVDSLRYSLKTIRTVVADGAGVLRLASGDYPALRCFEDKVEYTTVWVKLFGSWTQQTNDTFYDTKYFWWGADRGYTLMEMEMIGTSITPERITFSNGQLLGSEKPAIGENSLQVGPIPSNEILHIKSNKTLVGNKVLITDMNGRVLITASGLQGNSAKIPVVGLAEGLYFYSLRGEGDIILHTGKFSVLH